MAGTTIEIPDRIEAGSLALVAPTDSYIDAVVEAVQDPEIPRWTTIPSPFARGDAESFFERQARERSVGTSAVYLITTIDGSLVGATGMHAIDTEGLTAGIGYWVAARARGHGVATRAVGALVEWGFDTADGPGLRRIAADVMDGNDASRRVLERVGFRHEGTLRSLPAGSCGVGLDRVDMHVYAILDSDPR